MKKGALFITAFAAAAITFGSLMAFVGPKNSGWNHYERGWHHRHCSNHSNEQPATMKAGN